MTKNGFLNPFQGSQSIPSLEEAWSPTKERAEAEFALILRQYAQQIPEDKGLQAWIAYRDMIGGMFPGQLPAPAALAILTVIAANAVSSVVEQMEGSLEFNGPEASGRRAAISDLFEKVLNHASQTREAMRLAKMFQANGGLKS